MKNNIESDNSTKGNVGIHKKTYFFIIFFGIISIIIAASVGDLFGNFLGVGWIIWGTFFGLFAEVVVSDIMKKKYHPSVKIVGYIIMGYAALSFLGEVIFAIGMSPVEDFWKTIFWAGSYIAGGGVFILFICYLRKKINLSKRKNQIIVSMGVVIFSISIIAISTLNNVYPKEKRVRSNCEIYVNKCYCLGSILTAPVLISDSRGLFGEFLKYESICEGKEFCSNDGEYKVDCSNENTYKKADELKQKRIRQIQMENQQRAINYLQNNKETVSQEELIMQLRDYKYSEDDIKAAIEWVYQEPKLIND